MAAASGGGGGGAALPPSLTEFCVRHGIDARMYSHVEADVFPRFIRVAAAHRAELTARAPPPVAAAPTDGDAELAVLRAAFGPSVTRVAWLDARAGLYAMDGRVALASSPLYTGGLVHGIDASSVASVLALDPAPGDRVLDMCCAPGAKLCLIADLMGAAGALVGVDASVARLSTCASLLRKYALVSAGHLQRAWRLQLYGCDARLFNAAPPAVPLFTGAGGGAIAGMPPLSAVDFVRTRLAARCGGGGGRADGGDGGVGGGGSSDGSTGWLEGDSSCGGSELPPPSFTCSDGSEGEGGGSSGSGGDGGGVTAATTAAPFAAPVAVFAIAGSADAGGSGGGRGRASPAAAAPPARKAPRHVRHARGAAGHERLPLSYDAPLFDSLHENLFRRVREAPARGLHPVTTPRLLQVCRDVLDADAAAVAAHPHPPPPLPLLYDRVLVDAECSHDGSVKHVAKQLGGSRGGAALVEHMTADGKAASLRDLQRGLLANGFRVLRPGGVLVYSTCSLTVAQNEDVVAWLLATDPRASLLPLPTPPPPPPPLVPAAEGGAVDADALRAAFAALHASPSPPALPGAMPGTLRFEPLLSGCSGLFIARITKRDDSGPAPLPPPSSS